ncbi:hypothetical protein EJ110_NYTH59132, partial [Nymphaea thermarum]
NSLLFAGKIVAGKIVAGKVVAGEGHRKGQSAVDSNQRSDTMPDAAERRPESGFPTGRGTRRDGHLEAHHDLQATPARPGKATLGVRGSIVPAAFRTSEPGPDLDPALGARVPRQGSSHRSWRRAFFVDRSSWKLSSLNAVEVLASVFRLQPIRHLGIHAALGSMPPRDLCRLGIHAASGSTLPRDSCHFGIRAVA